MIIDLLTEIQCDSGQHSTPSVTRSIRQFDEPDMGQPSRHDMEYSGDQCWYHLCMHAKPTGTPGENLPNTSWYHEKHFEERLLCSK